MLDDFLTKVQVEEIYDEQLLEELNEFYKELEKAYEQEHNQSGRKGLSEDSSIR